MGDEIQSTDFTSEQFHEFEYRLHEELALFKKQLEGNHFDNTSITSGFETEAWLLNHNLNAAPANNKFLALAKHPLLVPELAKFNFEINSSPRTLTYHCLSQMQAELQSIWDHCVAVADTLELVPALFGILPTLKPEDLSLEHISDSNRFNALNDQILSQRKGRPLKVELSGHQHLRLEHSDVMLESATTSFQIHLQTPASQFVNYYNAALQVSAPLVAIAANSTYLFGKHVFAETRIPLFEQAVEVGGYSGAAQGPLKRVGFGSGYLKETIAELFQENVNHFPILLPTLFDEPPEKLKHLRLHNGTIWRWNRPLISVNNDARAQLRLEHRSIPAGPTLLDMFANAAFFYGLVHAMSQQQIEQKKTLPFATAKDNFYKAAQQGLGAKISWLDNRTVCIKKLITKTLLPIANEGLLDLNIAKEDRDFYLNIIHQRAESGQNGSNWQSNFLQRTGGDMHLLTQTYLANQHTGNPVHNWDLPAHPQKKAKPELQIFGKLPDEFFTSPANQLYKILKGPTLFALPGHATEAIFISILLHGNEDSGLVVAQQLLDKYKNQTLPKPIYLFVGNIEAARYGLRSLNDQTDYNRTWPGSEMDKCAESELLQQVYDFVANQPLFASIDLHNNTGLNPVYACVNKLDSEFINLALLFSRTVVYFTRPRGVQSLAFANLCPSVTIECGKVGDYSGVNQAKHFIDVCLNLKKLPQTPISNKDIDLYHTVAQVKVPKNIKFNFAGEAADINFHTELEYMNFREISAGTPFGDCASLDSVPLNVISENGDEVFSKYFYIEKGLLRVNRPIMPSMLTLDEHIIKQDCFCYLMERISPSK